MQLLMIVSFLAGLLHMIAPDHWLPLSFISWQKSWSRLNIIWIAFLMLIAHVILGCAFYLILLPLMKIWITHSNFLLFCALFLGSCVLLRAFRFRRIQEVLRNDSKRIWVLGLTISFLGPAESLVPILAKTEMLDVNILAPIIFYFLGSLISCLVLVGMGYRLWGKPYWLSRGIIWAERQSTAITVIVGLSAGLSLILSFQ